MFPYKGNVWYYNYHKKDVSFQRQTGDNTSSSNLDSITSSTNSEINYPEI